MTRAAWVAMFGPKRPELFADYAARRKQVAAWRQQGHTWVEISKFIGTTPERAAQLGHAEGIKKRRYGMLNA